MTAVSSPAGPGPTLLVLGDSLCFHGPRTAHPADEAGLWPQVAAGALGGRAEVHAGIGWTARHAWSAVRGDPRVWASVRRADALVLGVGGMDSLPSPLPTALRELMPVIRPASVRARVRSGYGAVHARASLVSARWWGGWPTALGAAETVRCLERCRLAVTTLLPTIPVVLLLPSVHRSALYGGVHVRRSAHVAALRGWAGEHGVRCVETAPLVAEHVLTGAGNPDGIHWGWPAHAAVGEAVAAVMGSALGRPEEPVVPTRAVGRGCPQGDERSSPGGASAP